MLTFFVYDNIIIIILLFFMSEIPSSSSEWVENSWEKEKLLETSRAQLSNLDGSFRFFKDIEWDYIKISLWNNPNTRSYAHDDGMTADFSLEWKKWNMICSIDASIITDKVNNMRADELELWCRNQIIRYTEGNLGFGIKVWGQIKHVGEHLGADIQNEVHNARDMPEVHLPYIESSSTWWIQAQVELQYDVINRKLYLLWTGNMKWNLDDSGVVEWVFSINWEIWKLRLNLWYGVTRVKWWNNYALYDSLGDGKGKALRAWLWYSINDTHDIGVDFSEYSIYQNGNYLNLYYQFNF